ncbi:MAG: hypothetical protein C0510_00520 [Erythrobacter sp.]|nr:hypothetical protein [Erythrobacter sp.]
MTIPDRIIRLRTVLESTGLSRSTVYRKIAEGTFPPQIKLGVHGAGWRESEINRWIADPVSYRLDGAEHRPKTRAQAAFLPALALLWTCLLTRATLSLGFFAQ